MKRLSQNISKIKFWFIIPLFIIVFFGGYLRYYNLQEKTHFDADQEELAYKAAEILSGDPVLLGQKTSIGGFSIGPGFTYLWAISSALTDKDPAAGSYLSVFLGILTIVGFYVLGHKLFGIKIGFVLAILTSFSLGFIKWDQNPWAPSLFYLAELFMLAGAYWATKNSWGLTIFSLGIVLGFNSHFGVFLSLISILFYWFLVRPKISLRPILWSLAILFVGLLPTAIYDVTHNFVNTKRLFDVVDNEIINGASLYKIFASLSAQDMGAIFSDLINRIWLEVIFVGVMLLGIRGAIKDSKSRSLLVLLICSIIIPALVFVFYKSNFSEYYLMMTVAPFVLLVGYLLSKLNLKLLSFVAIVYLLFSLWGLKQYLVSNVPLSLKAKKEAVLFIKSIAGDNNYGVSLTTSPGMNYGFKYIFDYYQMDPDIPPKKGQENIVTIVIPTEYEGVKAKNDFEGVGVLWEGPLFENLN